MPWNSALLYRALRPYALALATAVTLAPSAVPAEGGQADEYDVKAAFLVNFTKFVDWPIEKESGRVVICVVGDDPFGRTLEQLAKRGPAGARERQVRRVREPEEALDCHIAFIRSAEREKSSRLLEKLRNAPVLTVGESDDFATTGGIISLPVDGGRVGVVINTDAAEHARIKISAKLLSLAKLVPRPSERN